MEDRDRLTHDQLLRWQLWAMENITVTTGTSGGGYRCPHCGEDYSPGYTHSCAGFNQDA